MPSRGGFRGGKKPTKPKEEQRASLSCRVDPKTFAKIDKAKEAQYLSYGEILDKLVELMPSEWLQPEPEE